MSLITSIYGLAPGSIWHITNGQELLTLIVMMIVAVGMLLVLVLMFYIASTLRKAIYPPSEPEEEKSMWQQFTGLHAIDQEDKLVLEHAYDGIRELNNPTPPWFMFLFYITIGFGIIYWLVYHVFGSGDVMAKEYTQEVTVAEKQREAYIKRVAGSINENTVTRLTDAKSLDAGKTLYTQYCVACHGANGEGGVGPNLTDEFWLHGGSVKKVYHTISEGVPEKGMIAWKKQLNPLQIQQLDSYILSLQGTKPAGAKEPQGTKEAPGSEAAPADSASATASL